MVLGKLLGNMNKIILVIDGILKTALWNLGLFHRGWATWRKNVYLPENNLFLSHWLIFFKPRLLGRWLTNFREIKRAKLKKIIEVLFGRSDSWNESGSLNLPEITTNRIYQSLCSLFSCCRNGIHLSPDYYYFNTQTSLVKGSSFTHIKILLFCIHISLGTLLMNTAPPHLSGYISSLTDYI